MKGGEKIVKTDLLQFITNNYHTKESVERESKNNKAKNKSFEDVFCGIRKTSYKSTSNKNNDFKSGHIKNQVVKTKEAIRKESSIKEQYYKKDNEDSNAESELSKKIETNKLAPDENDSNAPDTVNKGVTADILYNYLISLITETAYLKEELLPKDLIPEDAENIVSALGLTELTSDVDIEQVIDLVLKKHESTILNEDNESNIDFVQKLDASLKQIIKEIKQEVEIIEKEAMKPDKIIVDESQNNNFLSIDQNNPKEKQIGDQNIYHVTKAFFTKEIELEEKNTIDKPIVSKNNILFEEELNSENIDNLKLRSVFTDFNYNNQSNIEKNIENTFESIVTKEKPFIIDKESIFEQIVEKIKVDIDKTDEIRIKLKPDFLGEISLKISAEKGIITAKAYVENFNIKELIESNLDNLRDNMKEMGINFEALDVSVGKDSDFQKNNSEAWKQVYRIKTKKPKLESIPVMSTYLENMDPFVGGLYSSNGNIDLIV